MNKKINSSNKLAIKMVVALILGLAAGIGFIVLRENLMGNGNGHIWTSINNILFQDISQEGATSALGIFYSWSIVCKFTSISNSTNGVYINSISYV